MGRCVPEVLDDGTAQDQDQAVAICLNMWRRRRRKDVEGMENRAYSLLDIREFDEDKREFAGVATTPSPDRLGDIVEPMGVKFRNPLPLLLFHQHDKPVGHVHLGQPTERGVTFRASIPKIKDAGILRDRVEEAWQSVKAGIVKGVSIGFKAIEKAFMKDGGIRFIKTEVLELSLVSVPANSEATIQTIRSLDQAASGRNKTAPGVSGKTETKGTSKMKSISEQISALEASRAAKSARMEDIMQKAIEEDRSPDDAEKEEFDDLEIEVKEIDSSLRRLNTIEKMRQQSAKPVDESGKGNDGGRPYYGQTRTKDVDLPPGIRFARVMKVKALAYLSHQDPVRIAEKLYGSDRQVVETIKADVVGAVTDGPTWAGPLIQTDGPFADFAEWLRPQTILGKFGSGGVPALRRVPFRVGLVGQTSGGSGYWVGESQPKPLTKFDFSRTTMTPLKVANITVLSEEVIRDSSPSAETIVRDQLAMALQERLDSDFIDPAQTAVAGIAPASITNGITPIPSSGQQIAAIREDIRALIAAFVTANNPPTNGVFIMSAIHALSLSILQNPLGALEFPTVGINGGTLFGMPVITSQHVPEVTAGGYVVLVNASDIYFADEGGIRVDVSREASLQMDDAPTNTPNALGASPQTITETSMVSLWQTNNVGFRAERTVNWMRRRDSGVAVLSAVNWNEGGSP
jgi:HK97 family phage major capsid protein/HK97 family phage prohead protease